MCNKLTNNYSKLFAVFLKKFTIPHYTLIVPCCEQHYSIKVFRYFPVREIALQTSGFHHLLLLHHHPPKIENAEHFRNYSYSGIHITLSLAHSKVRFH